jgi:hypothetical protein
VHHVTRIVIRARQRNRRERAPQRLLREKLGEIANGGGESPGALGVGAIVGEQVAVSLHVGAAARRVHDDRVGARGLERIDRLARHRQGPLVIAAVRIQRPAASLSGGHHHLASVLREHARGRAVVRRENDGLDASGQQRDARAVGSLGARHGRRRRPFTPRRHRWQERLPRRQGPGQEPHEA